MAFKDPTKARHARDLMKDRLFALLVALSAKMMWWFGAAGVFFQRVGEGATNWLSQFIAFFLAIPCFKVSQFFFKCTFLAQQRRLRFLGRECVLLGGYDHSLQFDNLSLHHRSVADVQKTLSQIIGRAQSSGGHSEFTQSDSSTF